MPPRVRHTGGKTTITLVFTHKGGNSAPADGGVNLSQSTGPASGSPTYPQMDHSGCFSDSASKKTGLPGEMMDTGICPKRKV